MCAILIFDFHTRLVIVFQNPKGGLVSFRFLLLRASGWRKHQRDWVSLLLRVKYQHDWGLAYKRGCSQHGFIRSATAQLHLARRQRLPDTNEPVSHVFIFNPLPRVIIQHRHAAVWSRLSQARSIDIVVLLLLFTLLHPDRRPSYKKTKTKKETKKLDRRTKLWKGHHTQVKWKPCHWLSVLSRKKRYSRLSRGCGLSKSENTELGARDTCVGRRELWTDAPCAFVRSRRHRTQWRVAKGTDKARESGLDRWQSCQQGASCDSSQLLGALVAAPRNETFRRSDRWAKRRRKRRKERNVCRTDHATAWSTLCPFFLFVLFFSCSLS